MSDERASFSKNFCMWIQSLSILIAAGLAFYQFFYKEIKVPKTAPINISMNLQLKKVGMGRVKNLVAVEMRVSASNPSLRRVYLLPAAFIIKGHKLAARITPHDIVPTSEQLMTAQHGEFLSTHSESTSSKIVAGGSLFQDKLLSPQETITRNMIFYVPRNEYDELDAFSMIVSTEIGDSDQEGLKLQWKIEDQDEIKPLFSIQSRDGTTRPAQEADRVRYGVLRSTSRASLSLWE